jgi:hypothetical protein
MFEDGVMVGILNYMVRALRMAVWRTAWGWPSREMTYLRFTWLERSLPLLPTPLRHIY